MRGWAILLTVFMLAAPLSGCLEGGAFSAIFGGGDEITAMEARDSGDAEAKAWQRDARLVGISTFESREGFEAAEDNHTLNYTADPEVGNGAAPAWALHYHSPGAGEGYSFVVHADGAITHKVQEPVEDDDDALIRNWRVDSDAAMEAARANATFRKAHDAAGANRTYGVFLFNSWEAEPEDRNESDDDGEDHEPDDEPEGTNWGILLTGKDTMAWAMVNASSGDVVMVMDMKDLIGDWAGGWSGGWGGDWNWSEGSTTYEACHAGRLDANNREDAYPFPVSPDAEEMRVTLEADKAIPTDGFTLVVTGPDGEEVTRHEDGDSFEWSEDDPAPGEYAVTLTAGEATVAVDYTLELWAGVPGSGDWDDYGDYDYYGGGDDDAECP